MRLFASVVCIFSLSCAPDAPPPTPEPQTPGQVAEGVPRVWIDTDPAMGLPGLHDPDDGWALLHALQNFPERLVGISLGYGNTEDFDHQERLVRRFLVEFTTFRAGPAHTIPVVRGATGANDLGVQNEATDLLIAALEQNPMTILALGRLTTVATVLLLRPDLADRILAVYVNGGRRGPEPERPALDRYVPTIGPDAVRLPDTNFDDDFDAVEILLSSEIPVVVVPVEFNQHHPITRELLEGLMSSGSMGARYAAMQSRTWLGLFEGIGAAGFWPFDVGVTLAYSHPELCQIETLGARIETGPNDTFRGGSEDKQYFVVSSTFQTRAVQYVFDAIDRERLVDQMAGELSGVVRP